LTTRFTELRLSVTEPDPLHAALDRVLRDFDGSERLGNDPLGIVREHEREEWEVVAHIAAPLAYGSVKLLRPAIRRVLRTAGASPTAYLRGFRAGDFTRSDPDFVYRMTRAEDVDSYFTALSSLLDEFGTLHAAFTAGDSGEGDIIEPLERYVGRIRNSASEDRRGFRYLTPDPGTGSACKRWHLMLRWLCRSNDGVDLGLWDVGAERLLMPLDTHTARLVRWLGLTARTTVDLKMAREVSANLRRFSPEDPMVYDMPLCHLGIAGDCLHRLDEVICGRCQLRGICIWTNPMRTELDPVSRD
jgi:uncharacterized protein (TIGR02757 family)